MARIITIQALISYLYSRKVYTYRGNNDGNKEQCQSRDVPGQSELS